MRVRRSVRTVMVIPPTDSRPAQGTEDIYIKG
jgi:hypothetical protein